METIKIKGMTCAHCKVRVEKALTALGLDVKVDLVSATAEISGSAATRK